LKLDIIIPVGPGHEQLVNEAVQSVKIACLTDQGPFNEVKIKAVDDTKGEMGRSAARNHGIKNSKADWLFFLDADDVMHAKAMRNVEKFLRSHDAIWGQITEMRDGCIVERFQMPTISSMKDLLSVDPYYTLQMGFFVKREVMPLFDESMNTGEDWKTYIHLWKHYKCVKVDFPFMVNRRGSHSTGPKSANGRQWMEAVQKLITAEKAQLAA
jgi:glycosyltransferase involved in cell wall biosynthesis